MTPVPGFWSDGGAIRCLRSLGTLADGVGDFLVLLRGAVAGAGNCGEVDEYVGTAAVGLTVRYPSPPRILVSG